MPPPTAKFGGEAPGAGLSGRDINAYPDSEALRLGGPLIAWTGYPGEPPTGVGLPRPATPRALRLTWTARGVLEGSWQAE